MALRDMLTPRVVELGAIKIGSLGDERKSRSGKTYRLPVKLDHFVITTKYRGNGGVFEEESDLMDSLREEYADDDGHLRRIPIAVLSDDIEDILRSSWVHYRGNKCIARSDGVTLWKYADFKTGEMLEEPEQLPWEEKYEKMTFDSAPLFKKHTSLDCVISSSKARWGGVYRFRTTSVISGDQIYGSLMHLKQLTGGVLVGMPLMLVVRPMHVSPNGKTSTVYVVHVELHGPDLVGLQTRALELAKFQREHRSQLSSMRREIRRVMSDPGVDEDEDLQAAIQQEFHPEPHEEEPDAGNARRVVTAMLSSVGCDSVEQRNAVSEHLTGKEFDMLDSDEEMHALLDAFRAAKEEGFDFSGLISSTSDESVSENEGEEE